MSQRDPYVWLYAFDVPTTPPTKLRLSPFPEQLLFERDEDGVGIPYSPFDISHGRSSRDIQGKTPNLAVTAQNVTQRLSRLLDQYTGLEGQGLRIVLIRRSSLPDGKPTLDESYEVLNSTCREGKATFNVGQRSITTAAFPDRRITRDGCGNEYGDAACAYDRTRVGALPTCSKRRKGTNGCEEHGDDEVAAGLPRLHPRKFLAFPGIQRPSGVGVG